jgi:hypothetical protein
VPPVGLLVKAGDLASSLTGNEIKRWDDREVAALTLLEDQKHALKANLAAMRCLDEQVKVLERPILAKGKLREEFKGLKTVSDIGDVLALPPARPRREPLRVGSPEAKPRICTIAVRDRSAQWMELDTTRNRGFSGAGITGQGEGGEAQGGQFAGP